MTIRVLVADDQDIVRAGLVMILDAQPDMSVIGEAANGREAITMARELRPDVCLLDIRMPELDGIEATRQLAGADVADPIPVDELGRVERTILRSALYEVLYSAATPSGEVIRDSVALARIYAGDAARRLVNGVLGSVSRSSAGGG
jgi:DNA-binding NarL/FixJ family response regulator